MMNQANTTLLPPSERRFVQNDQLQLLLNGCSGLSDTDKKYWTALFSVDGVGPSTFFLIANYMNKNRISWSDFWVNKNNVWSKMSFSDELGRSIKKFQNEYEIESYWKWLMSKDISVLDITQSEYPNLLKQIYDPPPILFVKGELSLLSNLPIAIVGTRKMTAYGKMVTQKIVQELVANDACIVSGFMYGVDVEAQKTAISQNGTTVGVLGYGFDHIYPGSQHRLINQMIATKKATFISEYPPFLRATKGTFPRRNRIIAGLSLGVVVTEAGVKSGTQITVDFALDYGRDIFAVSGPVTSPYHEGVKQMLNLGAMLVGSGLEVLNNLSAKNWQGRETNSLKKQLEPDSKLSAYLLRLNACQRAVVQALMIMPLTNRELADQLNLNQTETTNCLTDLEIRGMVELEANKWSLKKDLRAKIS